MGFAAPGPSESTGWHKAKRDSRVRTHSEGCWRWHNECAEALIEYQQVAIKRVRALHEFDGVHSCLGCRDNAPWPCDTIRAIEGEL